MGGVGGAGGSRLQAMALVDRHARPMLHHLTGLLLEPQLRQDVLTLMQVRVRGARRRPATQRQPAPVDDAHGAP
jgi:hypothetical protein